MPAQYTHQILSETIFQALPENIRNRITSVPSYYLGAQGGDVYYFFRVRKGRERNLGAYLHNNDVYEVFCSLQKAARTAGGEALSYIAGYITHYAGDIVFHPYVYGLMSSFAEREPKWRGKRHAYIENDLDSYFIEKYRGVSVQDYVSPLSENGIDEAKLYDLLSGVCRDNGQETFSKYSLRNAVGRFFRFEWIFTDKKLRRRKFFTACENVLRVPHFVSSLYRRPDYDARCVNENREEWHNPSCASFVSHESAMQLFERAVREGVRLIDTFFICLDGDAPLPREDFDKSFLTGEKVGVPLVRPAADRSKLREPRESRR